MKYTTNRQNILAVPVLVVMLLIPYSYAHAGFLDWFGIGGDSDNSATQEFLVPDIPKNASE